jgi:hypothetical protein
MDLQIIPGPATGCCDALSRGERLLGLGLHGEHRIRVQRSDHPIVPRPDPDIGFAEFYDSKSGEPPGGSRFTWTAAMVLEFLALAD